MEARSDASIRRRAAPREAPPEELAYVVTLNTGSERRREARRAHRRRPQARLADLRHDGRPARHAERRRRAAPLRLERLLVGAVPVGAAPARRAALPPRARAALVADPRRRRQGRPGQPEDRQGHRGRRTSPGAPATAARTPSTAAPTASTSRRSAAPDGDGPGGVFLLDHDSFDPLGRWEIDRGPQELAYDVWWNIGYDRC